MNYSIDVGVINPDQLKTWDENQEPYDILNKKTAITNIDWMSFLSIASKLFTEEVKVDWGSFAYKATKDQLRQLVEKTHCKIEGLEELPDDDLGVVFVEM